MENVLADHEAMSVAQAPVQRPHSSARLVENRNRKITDASNRREPLQSNSTPKDPSPVESLRFRDRSTQINDPIDTTTQQMEIETALPNRGRWLGLLYNILQNFLEILRNPFFVPLCFVLALLYLILSFMASLVGLVHVVQSTGTVIGTCFSFARQYASAWIQSVRYAATTSVHQMVSAGVDVTIGAMNKTAIVVCSQYYGWWIVTSMGLDCLYSVPYQPLDNNVGDTLNNTTLRLDQIADTAVELLPYGRQLTISEIWLRQKSYTVLESDLIDKDKLAEHYRDYTDKIALIGEELTSFVSQTDAHIDFQKYNLEFLRGQIEQDDPRIWWFRLFYSKESYIRDQYILFIDTADGDLLPLLESGGHCLKLIHEAQHINGKIRRTLEHNRNIISKEVDERSILLRWLKGNEDLTRQKDTIDNMDEYLNPVLHLLGSIIDKVRDVRTELSTLSTALKRGHVGSTPLLLMTQMKTISSGIQRLEHARDRLFEGQKQEEARHQQQMKDKLLRYKPMSFA